jgi:hypothetical protein
MNANWQKSWIENNEKRVSKEAKKGIFCGQTLRQKVGFVANGGLLTDPNRDKK